MIELKDITPELIQNAEGAELDRLCFDLGLAPDGAYNDPERWHSGGIYLLGRLRSEATQWHPSTNIAQAVEMAERFADSLDVVQVDIDIYSRRKLPSPPWASVIKVCLENDNPPGICKNMPVWADPEKSLGDTLALALTRACCLAALARIRSGE